MIARPGLGHHTDSSSNVHTPGRFWTHSRTSSTDSTVPNTPSKKGYAGVDPHEVTKRLKKLTDKIGRKPDSKQAKYIQAKADLAHRRNLVLLMVYAFMAYGAPSHRIEEYTLALFKALDMEGRVNYTVGCTNISFINPIDPADPMTRSAYTTLVKAQGLDIGACEVAFRIYKDVVHGNVTVSDPESEFNPIILLTLMNRWKKQRKISLNSLKVRHTIGHGLLYHFTVWPRLLLVCGRMVAGGRTWRFHSSSVALSASCR